MITVGDRVVWRCVLDQGLGYAFDGRLLEASPATVAVVQPHGGRCWRRTGPRVGPRGLIPPGAGDGHVEHRWPGPTNVRLHVVGTTISVIRNWDPAKRCFTGWYVNLELPWRPSPVGYDSRDLVLDLTVADDLSRWRFKDGDQLRWLVAQGMMSARHAEWIRGQGAAAAHRIDSRGFPFATDWSRWAPTHLPDPAEPTDAPAPPWDTATVTAVRLEQIIDETPG